MKLTQLSVRLYVDALERRNLGVPWLSFEARRVSWASLASVLCFLLRHGDDVNACFWVICWLFLLG